MSDGDADSRTNGTRGGTRTPGARLRTAALYPLSYAGPPVRPATALMLAQQHASRRHSRPSGVSLAMKPSAKTRGEGHLLIAELPTLWYDPRRSGSSAARLARSVRDAEVGGSNPL